MSDLRRSTVPWDDGWTFTPDATGTLVAATLPHGVPIEVPGSWEDHVGGVGGLATGWYRRPVEIPEAWDGDHVVVRFGAVMERCQLWLDGVAVGAHEGGYLPFEIALDGHARRGATHELIVRVHNPFGAFERQPAYNDPAAFAHAEAALGEPFAGVSGGKQTWYTATSGLVRPVTLERRPAVHLGPLRIRPDLAAGRAMIRWTIEGRPRRRDDGGDWTVTIRLCDPDGRTAATWSADGVGPGASGWADMAIPSPVAWAIGAPVFYQAEATLARGGGPPKDAVSARFGMRDIATRDGRVLLNGRALYLLGALDQDFYPGSRSTPPSRAFLLEQIARARELGLNLLRCHITIPDDAYLEAADEAGLLVWCELPNWNRFSAEAGERGLRTLDGIVDALGNHPSILAWTIINEAWGTDVRRAPEQRAWLHRAYDHIQAADPTRLVIDNSACGLPGTENFHVRTDLADFHVYHLTPDHADRWRDRIASFATRPAWLWSPAGDAAPRGDEPLILSEFGSWGLPDTRSFLAPDGAEPWWFATGPPAGRAGDMADRIRRFGLGRVLGGYDGLIRATQEHQWEALRYEIAELRRHAQIAGYVITEFSDIYWEANGLLDMHRRPKAFHDRFATINAPDVVVGELEPRDRASGERVRIPVTVSAWGDGSSGGHVAWSLVVGGATIVGGRLDMAGWPTASARVVGVIEVQLPDVVRASRAHLALELVDADGRSRATADVPFAILPATPTLDHRALAADLDVRIADKLDPELIARVRAGGRVLLLAKRADAIDSGVGLPFPVIVHPRSAPHPYDPAAGPIWQGDWISTFAWLRSETLHDLSDGRCLDLAFQRVLPDHVLLGHPDPASWDDVSAGLFAGWVQAPAAITWSMPIGAGQLTITTFQLGPDNGPVANALFAELVRATARPNQPRAEEASR